MPELILNNQTEISTIGIVGSDGVRPNYDKNDLWRIWSDKEVWEGGVGLGKFIPKVGDHIRVVGTYIEYVVIGHDPVTLIPDKRLISDIGGDNFLVEEDILFGAGPSSPSETAYAYLDTTVIPHTLALDKRHSVYGDEPKYAKIFVGNGLDPTDRVISAIYDNNQQFLTDKLPLKTVAIDSHTNIAVKAIPTCQTLAKLKDGEVITVVAYGDQGNVEYRKQYKILNTSFINSFNATKRYIIDIALESPFMSPNNNTKLLYPINVPISTLNLKGIVTYSDNKKVQYDVDGTKFSMDGIDTFVPSIGDHECPLVLRYNLSEDEDTVLAINGDGKAITKPYWIQVAPSDYNYNVKLYGFPVWMGQAMGYRLRWFLMNLNRQWYVDVTDKIRYSVPYDPKAYGVIQRFTVTVNLKDIGGYSDKSFIHPQLVDVILKDEPDGRRTPWIINNQAVNRDKYYGENMIIVGSNPDPIPYDNRSVVNISFGCKTVLEWLDKVYYSLLPLTDSIRESKAPLPTHVELFQGDDRVQVNINDFDKPVALTWNAEHLSTMFMRFYGVTATSQKQLAIGAAMVSFDTTNYIN